MMQNNDNNDDNDGIGSDNNNDDDNDNDDDNRGLWLPQTVVGLGAKAVENLQRKTQTDFIQAKQNFLNFDAPTLEPLCISAHTHMNINIPGPKISNIIQKLPKSAKNMFRIFPSPYQFILIPNEII